MLPNPSPRIVLASTSRWRREMLRAAGIVAESAAPDCDETSINPPNPRERALARAAAKAEAILATDALVIGADQVCHLDGVVYSKPKSAEDHRRQLRELRGRTHTLTDGVAVRGLGVNANFASDARVTLRADLGDDELDAYVATGDADGCCGGYRVEGLGASLIERVDGDWYTVIGLPLFELITTLRAAGWRPAFEPNTSASPPKVCHE